MVTTFCRYQMFALKVMDILQVQIIRYIFLCIFVQYLLADLPSTLASCF